MFFQGDGLIFAWGCLCRASPATSRRPARPRLSACSGALSLQFYLYFARATTRRPSHANATIYDVPVVDGRTDPYAVSSSRTLCWAARCGRRATRSR